MLAWHIVATQMYQRHPNHGIHRPIFVDEITQRFWWRVGSSPCNRSSIYLEGGILNGLPWFSTNTAMTYMVAFAIVGFWSIIQGISRLLASAGVGWVIQVVAMRVWHCHWTWLRCPERPTNKWRRRIQAWNQLLWHEHNLAQWLEANVRLLDVNCIVQDLNAILHLAICTKCWILMFALCLPRIWESIWYKASVLQSTPWKDWYRSSCDGIRWWAWTFPKELIVRIRIYWGNIAAGMVFLFTWFGCPIMACADYKGGVINNIDACAGVRRGCVFKPHLFCSGLQVATGHRRDGIGYLGFNSLTAFCCLQNPRRKGTACLRLWWHPWHMVDWNSTPPKPKFGRYKHKDLQHWEPLRAFRSDPKKHAGWQATIQHQLSFTICMAADFRLRNGCCATTMYPEPHAPDIYSMYRTHLACCRSMECIETRSPTEGVENPLHGSSWRPFFVCRGLPRKCFIAKKNWRSQNPAMNVARD